MRISKITIQGMNSTIQRVFDIQNDSYVYLTGRNGSGKSTVLQAVQFALLGYVPETGKTKDAVFSHCNGYAKDENGNPMMSVIMDFDNGYQIIRRMWKEKSKIESSVTTIPENLDIEKLIGKTGLPIFNFAEFIGLSANKLKDYFISIFPETLGSDGISVASELHKPISGMVLSDNVSKWMVANLPDACYPATVESVRALCTRYKEDVSATKADIDRLTSTIRSLVYYDDCDASKSVDEISQEIEESQNYIGYMQTVLANMRMNASIIQQCDVFRDKIIPGYEKQEIVSRIEYLHGAIKLNIDLMREKSDNVKENRLKVKEIRKITDGGAMCPYTMDRCHSIAEKIESMREDAAGLSALIGLLEKEIQKISDDLAQYEAELLKLNDRIVDSDYAAKIIEQKMSGLAEIPPQFSDSTVDADVMQRRIESMQARIQELTEKKAHIIANQRYENLLEDLTREKAEAEQKLDILKAWVKVTDTNGLQTTLADAPFKALEKSMDRILTGIYGDSVVTVFNTSEGANKFSFGMSKYGSPYVRYSSLSSGEKCVFTLALLIAMTEYNESDFKIIMIDDFFDHLDDHAVERCFKTLSDITDIQIIVAGVKSSETAAGHTIRIGE